MFYLTNLTKDLSIFPSNNNIDIKTLISKKVKDLEGNINRSDGYIVSILEFKYTDGGIVDTDVGSINFKVDYKSITFKLIKGEIIKTIILFMNEHGIFCNIGPIKIFISRYTLKDDWLYDIDKNIWSSKKHDKILKIDDVVIVNILETRINSNEIVSIGTLNCKY